MEEERMRELARIHAGELDAEFETFEHEGAIYHQVGLMNAWVRGYTDPDRHMFTEPPAWRPEFLDWIERHGGVVGEMMVGPPVIRFRDADARDAFKREWHDRARERYPYAQRAEFERRRTSLHLKPVS